MGAALKAMASFVASLIMTQFIAYIESKPGGILGLFKNPGMLGPYVKDFFRSNKDGLIAACRESVEFNQHMNQVIVDVAATKGIVLDPYAPLSPESITQAINAKIESAGIQGLRLTNIMDVPMVKKDVMRYGAAVVLQKSGFQLNPEDPFSKESFSQALSDRTGIPFSDITNPEQVKNDLFQHAEAIIVQNLAAYSQEYAANYVGGIQRIAGQIEVTKWVKGDSGNPGSYQKIMRSLSKKEVLAAMRSTISATTAGTSLGVFRALGGKLPNKLENRKRQNREAQARFRARAKANGYGIQYKPKGGEPSPETPTDPLIK